MCQNKRSLRSLFEAGQSVKDIFIFIFIFSAPLSLFNLVTRGNPEVQTSASATVLTAYHLDFNGSMRAMLGETVRLTPQLQVRNLHRWRRTLRHHGLASLASTSTDLQRPRMCGIFRYARV